ncbi:MULTISPECIES: hypothetical protein [unclassified Rhizobacter]|uniref:hypothetical protein n=1 Tax=unclassified Rhizobacter TaxID=2640088 RepID=UPI0006F67ACF|nr:MULTISPECIES: hypothetical protein [unclassified Rhizobacter]KQU71255.1 hypothetical protein ASC88_05705 [Rhizobacter sp. Root29]KQV97060.1 hypothetical protein ASC98_13075 [Rhizobacter sp. Root1238]KRB24132.1 hypothetical protein ASE08_18975 [Rhizobacter sp. Root16D2]
MEITRKSRQHKVSPSPDHTAPASCDEGKALIETLGRELGIDISQADKATQAKYKDKAFTRHPPFMHPACALWFARQCLALGEKHLFREVVNTFQLKRLQGIVEGAGIVTSSLKHLPQVHQVEFAAGCELTTECIVELGDVLKERRTAPFELDLHGCITCCDALLSLAWALPGLRGLAMLSISSPQVCDDGDWITALAAGLVHNTELVAFRLGVPDLTQQQAEAMGEGCRSLTELHFECRNLNSLAHLLKALGEKAPQDPDSPGTAARPLAALSIIGRTGSAQAFFPTGSVGCLRELIARCPSLKCVRISPLLQVQGIPEFEDMMALCDSEWKGIKIDINFGLAQGSSESQPGGVEELDTLDTGRALKPTLAYLRRKDASHHLLPRREIQGQVHRLLAAALQRNLPGDVLHEITCKLVADRSPPARLLVILNKLSRINKTAAALDSAAGLRRAHVERLKGLLSFSAFAFGTHELADPLCMAMVGWPLKGRLLKKEDEKALKSLILAGRPDSDALKEAIRRAEAHRWQVQKCQAHHLLSRGFEDEFIAEQGIRHELREWHRDEFNVDFTDLDMQLLDASYRVGLKKAARRAAQTVSNFFQSFIR